MRAAKPFDYLLPPHTSADEFRGSYIIPMSADPFADDDPFASDPLTTSPESAFGAIPKFTSEHPTPATAVGKQPFCYDNPAMGMSDNTATLPVHELASIDENVYSLAEDDPTSPILDQVCSILCQIEIFANCA